MATTQCSSARRRVVVDETHQHVWKSTEVDSILERYVSSIKERSSTSPPSPQTYLLQYVLGIWNLAVQHDNIKKDILSKIRSSCTWKRTLGQSSHADQIQNIIRRTSDSIYNGNVGARARCGESASKEEVG